MDEFNELLGINPPSPAALPAAVPVPITAGNPLDGGSFDAADRFDQALNQWCSPLMSADADILPDKAIIDGRTRDMVRNDAFVQGGASLHKDNIVGAQYLLNTRPSSKVIFEKQDDVWEAEFQEEVEEKFDLYAESPNNWMDAQRVNTFTSLVRLAVGIYLSAGEVLATAEWVKDGSPFNTAIQMIDTDRLSTDPASQMDTSVRAGIRYDSRGAPLAYQIRTEHPQDIFSFGGFNLPAWKEIPIRKPWGRLQVMHILEQTRPDQSRGVSELATSLREMKFSRKFRDTQLQRAIMQSLYAAAITSELPKEQIMAAMGGSALTPAGCAESITNYATGFLESVANYTTNAKGMRLDGARIPVFFPGTKLEMLSTSQNSAIGTEFEQSLMRYIAASLGVSYEQFSRDYSQANYSSMRAAMTETWKFMQARKKLVADRAASIMFRLWLEEAINKNEITSFAKSRAPLLYTGGRLNLKFDAISRADWVGASRGQIDELKETQAAVLRINNNLSTAEDELARLGKDWRKVYRQIKREKDMRDVLGLINAVPDPNAAAAAAEPTDTQTPKKAAA